VPNYNTTRHVFQPETYFLGQSLAKRSAIPSAVAMARTEVESQLLGDCPFVLICGVNHLYGSLLEDREIVNELPILGACH
jgi:hypothetical protein